MTIQQILDQLPSLSVAELHTVREAIDRQLSCVGGNGLTACQSVRRLPRRTSDEDLRCILSGRASRVGLYIPVRGDNMSRPHILRHEDEDEHA